MSAAGPSRRWRLFWPLLSASALGLVLAAYGSWQLHRCTVTVRNDAPVEASGIELVIGTRRLSIAALRSGDSRVLDLVPQGESDLELQFQLAGERCRHVNGYVESARGYRLEVVIAGCNTVRSSYGIWP